MNIRMNELRKTAKTLGIKAKNLKKIELVKKIQKAEGNFDCFGTAKSYCDQDACCFREDCLSLNH